MTAVTHNNANISFLNDTVENAYMCGIMQQLVLEAMAAVVCLNEDYRPTRMFPEMANLLHFFSQSSQL